jgi:hypothetical protein
MGPLVRIEDIEGMRRRLDIDDVELRHDIRGLGVGDAVRLTLLTGDAVPVGETVVVRITAIDGRVFRGTLAARPATKGLSGLRAGSPLSFTADHIHSLLRARTPQGK